MSAENITPDVAAGWRASEADSSDAKEEEKAKSSP